MRRCRHSYHFLVIDIELYDRATVCLDKVTDSQGLSKLIRLSVCWDGNK